MARNKQGHRFQSPKKYLLSGRARSLSIHGCWINQKWEEMGLAEVVVAREHVTGNITFGLFLVDIYCAGLKDTAWKFNMSPNEFSDFLERFKQNNPEEIIKADYNLVHNIIFEAISFAEELGIHTHPDFAVTRMILERDEDIPLMDVPMGDNGKPHLLYYENDPNSDRYLAILERNLEPDEYYVTFLDKDGNEVIDEDTPLFEDPAQFDRERWRTILHSMETVPEDDDFEVILDQELPNPLVYHYIFDKAIYEPEIAAKQLEASGRMAVQEVKISYTPKQRDFAPGELEEMTEIHKKLAQGLDASTLEKLVSRIKKAIDRWPNNPTLYNHLQIAYGQLGITGKADELTDIIYEKFPDYLLGKIQYATKLIDKGKSDEVPPLFNNSYTLMDLYPGTKEFHIQDFALFNLMWAKYFLAKDELPQAFLHWNAIQEIDAPDTELTEQIGLQLYLAKIKAVDAFIQETSKDPDGMEDLLDLLTA